MKSKIIAWWSGGITSAVTCKLCVDLYGIDNVRFIFIDTKNEDEDTYRFKLDCEKWFNKEIETITGIGDKYQSIEEVWFKNKSLNVASGAVCSSELKRRVREIWQKQNEYTHQAFGFELDEIKRAKSMSMNNPKVKAIYPLLMFGLSKKDCIDIVEQAGIEIKMKRDFPDKFNKMADVEHQLTDLKGTPVTMLKDQSENGGFVFLKPHPKFDFIKDISKMKGREPEPLFECNGFCGINDLSDRKTTEDEINYQISLF
jgi:PP-loop superfamily ATP-utilizing enzyme